MKQRRDNATTLLWMQAREWGVEVNEEQLDLLSRYADLIVGYELANVIGVRKRDEAILEHVTDALTCFLTGHLGPGKRLIDIGTGGGLPGIPLQIICSELQVTLLEATTKKANFLESVTHELGLRNTRVLNERAEEAGRRQRYRNVFQVAVVRAVGPLPTILEYSAPLVQPGGIIIAMKAKTPDEEIRAGDSAAKALGLTSRETIKVDFLPDLVQKERTLLLYQKVSTTPNRFPRRVGLAKKRPIRETDHQ